MDTAKQIRAWVHNWQRVGPILQRIVHEESRAASDDEHMQRFDELLRLGCELPNAKDRETSGLVEQQRWFAKARV